MEWTLLQCVNCIERLVTRICDECGQGFCDNCVGISADGSATRGTCLLGGLTSIATGKAPCSGNLRHVAPLAKQEQEGQPPLIAPLLRHGSAGQVVLRDPSDPDDSSSDTTGLIEVARQNLDIEYCARCNWALRSEGAVCDDCEQVFCWWCSVIHMCENRRGEEDEAKLLCKDHTLCMRHCSVTHTHTHTYITYTFTHTHSHTYSHTFTHTFTHTHINTHSHTH